MKELTGWTRDASRPEESIVPGMARETQENADRKEEEDKRLKQAADANAQAQLNPGEDKPADPLLAFMADPFGLHNSTSPQASSYSGDSLEEAIRRGDWSAAARIMNAVRAREESEHQDFSGDGNVAGSRAVATGYTAADYGPTYTSDSYGNWDYGDRYGGHYSNFGYQAADGSFTGTSGMKVSADGNITLSNGQTYETIAPATQAEKVDIASAAGDAAKIAAGIPLDGPPPSPDQLKNANPPGSAAPAVPNPDPAKNAMVGESTARAVKAATGRSYSQTRDPAIREAFVRARTEVVEAVQHKYEAPQYAGMSKRERETAVRNDLAVLDGSRGTAADRTRLYTQVLGDKYTQNADLYNAVDYGRFDQARMERLRGQWSGHHGQNGQAAAPATAQPAPVAGDTTPSVAATDAPAVPTTANAAADPWAAMNWNNTSSSGSQYSFGEFGSEYDGYWGEKKGFYDDHGFNDKDGGYTWDDTAENGTLAGGYADKNGNYVDKAGNLYLAGNNSETPDRVAADAPNGGKWVDILKADAANNSTFTLPGQTAASGTTPVATTPDPAALVSTGATAPSGFSTASAATASTTAPTDQQMDGFSTFMGGAKSFLTTSEVDKAVNTFAQSNFFDLNAPVTGTGAGASTVWGTKFFDPATVAAAPAAPAVDPAVDPVLAIAPTNPYYKPAAQGAGAGA